ncbi:MAG: ABC transporter ATP-binding protein [Proteobacteria bacterium]|nr:ABC transporter ATP-binding protein [Pseudomonadota bacterium]
MIRVSGLRAGYGGEPVLREVSLSVPAGDFVGVLGPNACGKSTLVRVLSGVLRSEAGSVEVNGLDVAAARPRDLGRSAAVVPQATAIPFPFTGFEVVLMGRYPRLGRFARETVEDLAAVDRALVETDTAALAERLVTQVSGGERQRLILARALAQEAPLLLLDEATAAMDVHRKIDAFDLLTRLNCEGTTVLAVLHDLNLAALYCRRLVFLRAGRIHADGPTAEVFTKGVIEAVYETPVEVFSHPATGRPHAVFLPRNRGPR